MLARKSDGEYSSDVMSNQMNTEKAHARLDSKIKEVCDRINRLKKEAGSFTHEDSLLAADTLKERHAEMSPRQWAIISIENAGKELKSLNDTKTKELIFPDGLYLLLPRGEHLISPAGFHPDERVFIKPSAGAIVRELPTHSNFTCMDFTK